MRTLFVSLTILLTLSATAQVEWRLMSETPGLQYDNLHMISRSTGYALGYDNNVNLHRLYKVENSGEVIYHLYTPDTLSINLQDLYFVDEMTGFVSYRQFGPSGLEMRLIKTTDGGDNWIDVTPDSSDVGFGTTEIHFVNQNLGFFSTGTSIYRTTDGGQNWTVTSFHLISINSIDFLDAQYGIAGAWDGTFFYGGLLLFTSDSGKTWYIDTIPQAYTQIQRVQAISNYCSIGIPASGFNTTAKFFQAAQVGPPWDTMYVNVDSLWNVNDMFFTNCGHGHLVTDEGKFYEQFHPDSGWLEVFDAGIFMKRMDFVDNEAGFAVGINGFFYATIDADTTSPPDTTANPIPTKLPTNFQVAPNPVLQGQAIQIQLANASDVELVELLNALGQVVRSEQVSGLSQIAITTDDLPSGVYWVKASNGTANIITEAVVVR